MFSKYTSGLKDIEGVEDDRSSKCLHLYVNTRYRFLSGSVTAYHNGN